LVFIAAYFERPMTLPLSIIFVPNTLLLAMFLLPLVMLVLPLVMLILPSSCVFYRTYNLLQLIDNTCDQVDELADGL
jgi:hypothetical protein